MITLITPANNTRISILTDVQREFLERHARGEHVDEDSYTWMDEKYAKGYKREIVGTPEEVNLTSPAYIKFRWKCDRPSHLVLSRSPDFSTVDSRFPNNPAAGEIISHKDEGGISSAEAGNLFAGVTYYWKIVTDDLSEESQTRSFTTDEGYPRTIYVSGTTNVRDLGGLPTYDGRRIRQGCIYRGSSLENIVDPTDPFNLTPRGKYVMREVLKIKNELEIRIDAVGKIDSSVLSPDVKFNHIVSRGYNFFFEDDMRENRRKLIEFFADENNYPIYFHCAIGADRTGTLAMFLQALLGVPKYYVELDYCITSLTVAEKRQGITEHFFYKDYDGPDPDEFFMKKAERLLIEDSGVSPETIARLRKNLLE